MYEPNIPAGRHRARADRGELTAAKTGTPMVYVSFILLDMPGKTISWYGYLSEKSEERTIESLRTAGWAGDDISRLDGLGDREVSLVVEWEEYDGRIRARVKSIYGPGGGGGKALAVHEQAALIERIKKKYGGKPSNIMDSRQAQMARDELLKNSLSSPNDDIPF